MEYINKVYKESNLEFNDSISTYNGWGAQQNPNTFEAFHNFIREVKPKRIIEIGTSIGGLTTFIDYTCKLLELDCKLISFDVNEMPYYRHMRDNGIDIRIENIFSEGYSIVKEEMIDFIDKNTGYRRQEIIDQIKSGQRDLEDFYLDILGIVKRKEITGF